ncbi:DUF6090 family protein [Lutimonas vermicola]|uniref:DUF6090 family protein n=1 Tax=Lutimonas vermicola TaxID=414288 RepID=A0ABU9KYJ5_9FLAO
MLTENKFSKYLLYAIGEIVLVVFGILIALSINNWQQDNYNRNLEIRYITDLTNNLKKDSTSLHNLYKEALRASDAKDSIMEYLNQHDYKLDSLSVYFKYQWNPYKIFSPSTSIIDEMKSNGHLKIIRNEAIRKQIVDIYYTYELFTQDENLYRESTREIFMIAKANLKNISDYSNEEVKALLQEPKLANTIRKNFANGRVKSVTNAFKECNELLRTLDRYNQQITKAQQWL